MKSMNRRSTLAFGITVAAVLTVCGGSAFADDMDVTLLTPDKLVWKDNPSLPKGAKVAVLTGDPTKTGEVIVTRSKFPPNYQIPPHTHPYAETITLVSGSIGFGVGEKGEKTGDLLKPGAFHALPANQAHYVWTGGEETIIEVHFVGPFRITYINPADDPRKK
ncbi:cupin domain-containing protein [Mesorhizobium sp.]|uniref:cupin domain-containing protein n=1 Tax=Mesorhizobium sp. TaxID=1871066 RepID=UPI00257DF1AB|nr:cupin domain-containing protein [Mesorhizobium sp.]